MSIKYYIAFLLLFFSLVFSRSSFSQTFRDEITGDFLDFYEISEISQSQIGDEIRYYNTDSNSEHFATISDVESSFSGLQITLIEEKTGQKRLILLNY